jgi:hypothetical protein
MLVLSRVPTSWRLAASGLAAVVLLSLVVAFVPEARTAAGQFLAQFRSQQVAAVSVSPQSASQLQRSLASLSHLGTFAQRSPQSPSGLGLGLKTVSLAEASQQVGFPLQLPDPAGLSASPRVSVMSANEMRFTFDKARARAYFQSIGHPEVSLPDRFDGAALVVSTPAAAVLEYDGTSGKGSELIIGEAGELSVGVDGKVSLDELREFLLDLPGLPPETVAQLRAIKDWQTTLPIPIPADKVNWQSVSFSRGGQGLLLNDNSGIGSAAVWQSGGHLYGVAGSFKATDLKRVADSLQ